MPNYSTLANRKCTIVDFGESKNSTLYADYVSVTVFQRRH